MTRRRVGVDLYTPMLIGDWQPVRPAPGRPADAPGNFPEASPEARPASRDLELSNALDDTRSVRRVQAAVENTRTAPRTRRPARPARREETPMYSSAHDSQRQAAVEALVPPPSAAQERAAHLFKVGHLGGVTPEPVTESEDDFRAQFPYGAGFDRFGRQLPSNASPDHSRAELARWERFRAGGYHDEAAQDARWFVAETFDQDGNLRPGAEVYTGHQVHEI